ncbi:hypothetical protein Taro_013108 [Colocasia esculenta]|uniref:Uncharacterized protein n=1 Tax=Colocasia esculenta TaxID=4460 RepID=A0A843U5S3_COLES|nr:hypothetical protein [Colocasia esculenta]
MERDFEKTNRQYFDVARDSEKSNRQHFGVTGDSEKMNRRHFDVEEGPPGPSCRQARLGRAVHAWDAQTRAVADVFGETVDEMSANGLTEVG